MMNVLISDSKVSVLDLLHNGLDVKAIKAIFSAILNSGEEGLKGLDLSGNEIDNNDEEIITSSKAVNLES